MGSSSRFWPRPTMACSSRLNGRASQMPKASASDTASTLAATTSRTSRRRAFSMRWASASFCVSIRNCACWARLVFSASSSRNCMAIVLSRWRALSALPLIRPSITPSWVRHISMPAGGRPFFSSRSNTWCASRAASSKRRRSTASFSTSDWRPARSMAALRSASDCDAPDRRSARAAASRLCVISASYCSTERNATPTSSAVISRNANSRSCWNEPRMDGRFAISGRAPSAIRSSRPRRAACRPASG